MNADIGAATPAPFSAGMVIIGSCQIFLRNFVTFVPLVIAIHLILLLAPIPDYSDLTVPLDQKDWWRYAVQQLLQAIVYGLTGAMAIFGPIRNLQGQKASIVDAFRGLRLALPVIGAAILCYLLYVAIEVAQSALAAHANAALAAQLALIVLSLVLLLMWWVSAPAIVIERKSIFAALMRSAQLTKGRRWSIFGILALTMILLFVTFMALAWGGSVTALELGTMPSFTAIGMASFAISALFSLFFAILSTVSYYYLRVEKEATGAEEINSVVG